MRTILQSAKHTAATTSWLMTPSARTRLDRYHIVQTTIFFACLPFFSESLCDRNSTSVAKAPASR